MKIAKFVNFSVALAVVGITALFANLPTASANPGEHSKAVKTHTEEAVKHGEMGHADVLATHAGEALKHAKALKESAGDDHYDALVNALEDAVEQGNDGNTAAATEHASMALKHINDLAGHDEMGHGGDHKNHDDKGMAPHGHHDDTGTAPHKH